MEELCRTYWQPIYVYLRRCGHECHNAKDLTQGFFVYVLEHGLLQKADPARGRFRSFLLGSLKFFVSNEQAKERALKRGGGACFIPLDAEPEERHGDREPSTQLTPERLFERKWALAVIGQAMARLEAEYRHACAYVPFTQSFSPACSRCDRRYRLGRRTGRGRAAALGSSPPRR